MTVHPYSTDSNERLNVYLILAGVSIALAWLLYKIVTALDLSLPWWLNAPSIAGFYALLTATFDRWLWRLPMPRRMGLVKIPDLRGTWEGEVTSSFDNHATHHAATAQIFQTWTHLMVKLRTAHSESRSLMAMVLTRDPNTVVLSYEYLNEPRAEAVATMHAHRGTARLLLRSDDVLEGEYYTGRDRQQYGAVRIQRIRE